jgi:hypothetical protein
VGKLSAMNRSALLRRCLRVALAVIVLNGLPARGQGAPAHIPAVHATSFSNEQVNLPEGLRAKVGVLVLGFSRGSRDSTTAWGKRLAADYGQSQGVMYYEMPVLEAVPKMIRGFVINQIKSSVPERERPRFVVVLENEPAWQAVVHYKEPNDAYVLVVDDQGVVRWQTHGAATDSAYGVMKQQVEALAAGMGHAGR